MASLYEHNLYKIRYSALPLGALWVSVFVGLAYLELQSVVPRWTLLAITAPAGFAALLHLSHALIRVVWAARTYGRHLPGFMMRMIRMFPRLARCRSETIKVLLHAGLAVSGFAVAALLGVASAFAPSALLLGIATTALLRITLPPGGVYLASSDPERIRFFRQLSIRVVVGMAALLDVSTLADPDGDEFLRNAVGIQFDFRTSVPDDWPDVVTHLIEMAAVVVVDGRDHTQGVAFEVHRIVRNRVEFKTVFLSEDGALPTVLRVLGVKASHPSGKFLLMTPHEALQAVPAVVMAARQFWVPVHMDTSQQAATH